MVKHHRIVISNEAGDVQHYPMKKWLRENPGHLPSDVDTRIYTSHQLRGILKRQGWTVKEGADEVALIPPMSLPKLSEIRRHIEEEDEEARDEEIESNSANFALEHQLRDFIAANIGSIEIAGKKLKVYIDATEREGVEFYTEVGRIDILATDEDENFYIFELKQGLSPDKTLGQLARYMGWAKHTVGKNKEVFGVIVAKTITEKLRFAASVVPNVLLYEYEVSFKLNVANELPR